MKHAIVDPNSRDARWQKYFQQCQKDKDKDAIQKVVKTEEGTSSYTGNAETYFREGRREVGIEITNLILDTLGLEEGHKSLQAIDKDFIDFKIRQNRIFNKED